MDSCNALYICATSDPKTGPGGCPISRQRCKTDIRYLDEAGLQKYGYTSMTAAALKLQEKQLAVLQQQVRELSAQLKAAKPKRK